MDTEPRDQAERPARVRQLAPYGYCRYCGAPRPEGARFCGGVECIGLGRVDPVRTGRASTIEATAGVLAVASAAPAAVVEPARPAIDGAARPADPGEARPSPTIAASVATPGAAAGAAAVLDSETAEVPGTARTAPAATLTDGWVLVAPPDETAGSVASTAVPASTPVLATPPVVAAGRGRLERRGRERDDARRRLVRDTSVLLVLGGIVAIVLIGIAPVVSRPAGGVLGATSGPSPARPVATVAPAVGATLPALPTLAPIFTGRGTAP